MHADKKAGSKPQGTKVKSGGVEVRFECGDLFVGFVVQLSDCVYVIYMT